MSAGVLGVVLAGGQSTRFGSDKALAELAGESLLARAIAQMARWCDNVVVVGRSQAPVPTIPDWPRPGMGPLGGIAGALHHAQAERYATVLTCGVDSFGLPETLFAALDPAPAFVASQPVIGHWPAAACGTISHILKSEARHSMLAFAEAIGARPVQLEQKPANINTPKDLAEAEKRDGI